MELSENANEILVARYLWDNEKCWGDLVTRVCTEVAKNERSDQEKWFEEFKSIMLPMNFIPAGRILRNIGKLKPSTSNCNFLPIEDNIESIFDTLKHYGIISSYGGGSGMNFSSLRPKGTPLITKGGNSSGMISFMEMFNFCGKYIETGGQRRSAAIGLCDVSHPEIFDFIKAKSVEGRLDQFNISIIVNKEFLNAVEADDTWELKFAGKVYEVVKARELWSTILTNMLEHAEPGLINWTNLKKNNSYFFAEIAGVNPCGEIGLENWGVCNLGAIVLPKLLVNKNVNRKLLSKVIRTAIRFMDNIIDIAYYPIPQQDQVVKNARRIGLGTMGFADYLFMKQIRYGSEQCLDEINRLYSFIRNETYIASSDLAKEKGAFPKYDKLAFSNASFVKKLPANIRLLIKEQTIRNTTLLSAQPTGTTALLADVVGGIEPLPFKGYRRVDGVGERVYISPFAAENYDADWFVDSCDLRPEEHLEVQVTLQKYIDSAVSKTIILPNEATVDDLSKFLLEFIYDLKGITIYRDGSRNKQVYYRLTRDEIKGYLKDSKVSSTLQEEDVQCVRGTCEV
uniref:ribonucleoside-diphosphate reductase n=1 Tax=viral metagenome TaxID=1070528 RepID=A0A6H1ZU40_9ZZZZ